MGLDVVNNEHKFDRYARSLAITLACQYRHESCANDEKFKSVNYSLHPDVQFPIHSNIMRSANEEIYVNYINDMFNYKRAAERTLRINSLGHSQNEDLLIKFLNYAINDDPRVRLQEKFRILSSWTNSGLPGVRAAMTFIKDNHEKINKITSTQVRSMLSNIAARITTEELTSKFTELLDHLITQNVINSAAKTSYLSTVANTKAWQDKNVKDIEEWLNRNSATSLIISFTILLFSVAIKIIF
jgi:hypothetical protein